MNQRTQSSRNFHNPDELHKAGIMDEWRYFRSAFTGHEAKWLCKICNKHLNIGTLSGHVKSEQHIIGKLAL